MKHELPDAEDAKISRRARKRNSKFFLPSFCVLRATFASSASGSPLPLCQGATDWHRRHPASIQDRNEEHKA